MDMMGVLTDRALLWQFVRYGVTGLGVTLVSVAVYWLLAAVAGLPVQVANVLAWLLAVSVGFVVHSRWSFRGHRGGGGVGIRVRFFAVAVLGLAVNALWVWLLVDRLNGAEWWPIPLMVFATPLIIFPLNRRWVFV